MVRVAKPSDPKRLLELKEKIKDPGYLEEAIQRIAQTLTKEIVEQKPPGPA
jgi:hypothetical protein